MLTRHSETSIGCARSKVGACAAALEGTNPASKSTHERALIRTGTIVADSHIALAIGRTGFLEAQHSDCGGNLSLLEGMPRETGAEHCGVGMCCGLFDDA